MVAIVLAILSSASFAASNIAIQRGLRGMHFFVGLLVNLVSNAILLWLFLLLWGEPPHWLAPGNLIFVGVGLFVPGAARYFFVQGLERLGSSVSAVVVNSTPLCSVLMAVAFLGERPTPTNLAGAVTIVSGITVLSWKGSHKTWRTRDLLFPAATMFLFAMRDNLVRKGLMMIQSPLLGAAIAVSTSTVAMGLFYCFWSRRRPFWRDSTPSGRWFFLLSGVLNFLSYVFLFTAMSLERVTIVSPLANCSSLFVLPFSYWFLKDIEHLTWPKIYATGLVVVGVFLISWEKL